MVMGNSCQSERNQISSATERDRHPGEPDPILAPPHAAQIPCYTHHLVRASIRNTPIHSLYSSPPSPYTFAHQPPPRLGQLDYDLDCSSASVGGLNIRWLGAWFCILRSSYPWAWPSGFPSLACSPALRSRSYQTTKPPSHHTTPHLIDNPHVQPPASLLLVTPSPTHDCLLLFIRPLSTSRISL